MNELREISSRAYVNSVCKIAKPNNPNTVDGYLDSPRLTKTKDRLLEDLFDLEMRLRKVALVLTHEEVKKELVLAAQWSATYYKEIQTNKDIGPMTHWYQMRQIHAVAIRCIEKLIGESINKQVETLANQIQRNNPPLLNQEKKPTVIKKIKELRAIIFTTLQEEKILEENELFTEIIGNNVDAEISLFRSCEQYIFSLPKDKYPDFIRLWSFFKEIKIRRTNERINMIDIMIESLLIMRINDAIVSNDEKKLLSVMLSPFMEEMTPSKKIEILKLAIDQKSTEMLELLTDSDWFSDLDFEGMEELIRYAKEPHKTVIQKSTGYMYYAKN